MAWPISMGGSAGLSITETQAQCALVGFAFGAVPLKAAGPPHQRLRYRWGYRSYDCVPTDPYRFTIGDFALTASLDSGIGAAAMLALEAVSEELSDILTRIPVHRSFWELPYNELGRNRPVAFDSEAEFLWDAWELLVSLERVEVGNTTAHKVLHRKRPWFFPLVDGLTDPALRINTSSAWQTIHRDLTVHAAEWEELERWFAAKQAVPRGAIPLTRLRMHDILLWGHQKKDLRLMQDIGQLILDPPELDSPEWYDADPKIRMQHEGRIVRHTD